MRCTAYAFVLVLAATTPAAAEDQPYPLGVAASGVVARVLVADGARVAAGQRLVELDCRPLEADIKVKTAALAATEAAYTRAKNGPRPDEIAIGEANVGVAQARSEEAADALARAHALTEGVTVTRAQILQVRRDARVSAAQLNDAQKRLALLHAGSRQEDIDEAKARRDEAAADRDLAKAKLDQCVVVAPVAGTAEVLVSPGQFVSEYAPAPLVRLTPDAK
jgi:multidrug resistance efflux pump